jgi:hypothetical protein
VSNNTASIYSEISNENNQSGSVTQQINIVIDGTVTCGALIVDQTAEITAEALSKISNEQMAQIQSESIAAYKTSATQAAEQLNEVTIFFFPFVFFSLSFFLFCRI